MGLEDRLLEGSTSNYAVVMINDATFFFDFLRKKKKKFIKVDCTTHIIIPRQC